MRNDMVHFTPTEYRSERYYTIRTVVRFVFWGALIWGTLIGLALL
jgi:hypothetical protein